MKKTHQELFAKLVKYSRYALRPVDKILETPKGPLHDLVFIIGAPRSGSTILYQILTNYLDVLYFDNLVHLFHRNIQTGMWLSQKIFKDQPHNCYKSVHGNTMECGLHAPSECGPFWRQYLSDNKHYLSPSEAIDTKFHIIKHRIGNIIAKHHKPLIIKNLVLSQRLNLIRALFPDAKIIFIKRDPVANALSILNAREKLQINSSQWWSVKPKNYEKLLHLADPELVVKQIFHIEKQIHTDLPLFPKKNILTLGYEACLADNFNNTLGQVADLLNHVKFKPSPERVNAESSKPDKKENPKYALIKEEVSKLDWINYVD